MGFVKLHIALSALEVLLMFSVLIVFLIQKPKPMRVKNLIMGHQEWLICWHELGYYENPKEQSRFVLLFVLNNQGYSHDRGFYLDVEVPIFVTTF